MPKVLIVAATQNEIQPLLKIFKIDVSGAEGLFESNSEPNLFVLITGVGMVNTAYYLGRYSHNLYDIVINVGICGSFNKNIKIGEVVNVVTDTFSEMGAEDGKEFIKYVDLNLGGNTLFNNQVTIDFTSLNELKNVNGITVNTIHGNEESIQKTTKLFNADVESMEGAAFFKGCHRLSENYFQIRAVSNYVEKRDKSKWDIPLAINNLNNFVTTLLKELIK
ncbi:MAG: futalosine hydrolase [Bacteroidota bacterium]|nr:futalosine hydrolase [Bacteroidota bacterium]MDP3146752.1 futalosine hydrolase [Bacteroidota bacterium]